MWRNARKPNANTANSVILLIIIIARIGSALL